MLTRLLIRNFKTLEEADIPLGQNVVLIGPNNSGKTSALQALALWRTGLTEWNSRRNESASQAKQRVGVTLNRKLLTHTPVAQAKSLCHALKVNSVVRENGSQHTRSIYLDLTVEGETAGSAWVCGFEFYHANQESIYCRPIRIDGRGDRLPVPEEAAATKIALLPPMSGLASEEAEVQPGRISVLLGEGQTAQVLRNLCFQVAQISKDSWNGIASEIKRTFGVDLDEPRRDPGRGTIEISYRQNGIELDLPSAGRGLQQTLLLLAHLYANPGSVLLLDEPDAHLEILRQRQIYSLLSDTARRTGSQFIAASHSEILLNEAADKDVVVAFVGKPHRIDDRGSQVLKSLKEIGFEQYYQAELRGFVLYLEGSTDLAILRAIAQKIDHPAAALLDSPFVHYVQNQPKLVEHHFYGLREAKGDLKAVAVFDRLEHGLPPSFAIPHFVWAKREIENYLCLPEVLLRYAEGNEPDDLVGRADRALRRERMENAIQKVANAIRTLRRDPWSDDEKVSDEFLPSVSSEYFASLQLDNRMNKSNFHTLVEFILPNEIHPELVRCLDLIVQESSDPSAKAV
jgi:ABC-type cobalamin/Fe3+-siderophores transport system ATPase subunit